MNVINKSGKIVNIGQKAVMPGDPATIDDSFADNDVIKLLVDQGILAISKKTDAAAKKAAEEEAAAKKKAEEEAAAKKKAEEAAAKGGTGSGSK